MRTEPPRPPSPPDGPPRGTNFSRRNAVTPLPPSPPFTNILARSRNCISIVGSWQCAVGSQKLSLHIAHCQLLCRINADELASPALLFELYDARDHREQRVIRAASHAVARFELGPALTHENLASEHGLSAETFDAQPLRV